MVSRIKDKGRKLMKDIFANKKLILIIGIICIMIILVIILFLTRDKGEEQVLFEEVGYPVSVEQEKNGDMQITLDGSQTPDLSWSAKVENEAIVSCAADGEEKKGKITYRISPKAEGETVVNFERSGDLKGTAITATSINMSVRVITEEGKLKACSGGETVMSGTAAIMGENTETPFVLENALSDSASIYFPKGNDEWWVADPNGILETTGMTGENGEVWVAVYRKPADEGTTETTEGETEEATEAGGPADMVYVYQDGEYKWVKIESLNEEYTVGWSEVDPEDVTEVVAEPDTETTEETFTDILARYAGTSKTAEDGTVQTVLLCRNVVTKTNEFINVTISPNGVITLAVGKEP